VRLRYTNWGAKERQQVDYADILNNLYLASEGLV